MSCAESSLRVLARAADGARRWFGGCAWPNGQRECSSCICMHGALRAQAVCLQLADALRLGEPPLLPRVGVQSRWCADPAWRAPRCARIVRELAGLAERGPAARVEHQRACSAFDSSDPARCYGQAQRAWRGLGQGALRSRAAIAPPTCCSGAAQMPLTCRTLAAHVQFVRTQLVRRLDVICTHRPAKLGRLQPIGAKIVQRLARFDAMLANVGPMLAKHGPKFMSIGPSWSISAQLAPNANVRGQTRAKLMQRCAERGKHRSIERQLGPIAAEFGQS